MIDSATVSPALARMKECSDTAVALDNDMRQWREQGYVIRREVLDPDRCARLREIAERIWERAYERNAMTGAERSAFTSLHFCHHPDYLRGRPEDRRYLLEAGADPEVLDIARRIHGEEPLFRGLSLWFSPTESSSDGHWHRDTQFVHPDEADEFAHFGSFAENYGNGMQMQIALVPSDDSEYVPGSHLRWDTPQEHAIRRANGAQNWRSNAMPGAVRVALGVGDAVAFNPIGLHRGRYHVDKLRRTFMVTVCRTSRPQQDVFADQPWFLEPDYSSGLSPHASAFYRRFVATYQDFILASKASKAAAS
jgi:ectoine hydroxylase-related dioxygenase (phytanoyl-CoA dioxygenase family)